MKISFWGIFIVFGLLLASSSCKKEIPLAPGILTFSADSVIFDTIFTNLPSPSARLYLYNNSNQDILIENIRITGGAQSEFTLTFDGVAAQEHHQYKLRAKDSVLALINFTSQVKDQATIDYLVVSSGSFSQTIPLYAFVFDGIYIRGAEAQSVIDGDTINGLYTVGCGINNDTIFYNSKKIVIDGPVYVEPGCTLRIRGGTQVYFTARRTSDNYPTSFLLIGGTLLVEGSSGDQRVWFTGIRQGKDYAEKSGQWQGIIFLKTSEGNDLRNLVIKNASVGIRVDSISPTEDNKPKVYLKNCEIRNMANFAVLGLGFSHTFRQQPTIVAENCLFSNAGNNVVGFFGGGKYSLVNCSAIGSGTEFIRRGATLGWNNYHTVTKESFPSDITILNTIIWGNNPQNEEIGTDLRDGTTDTLKVSYSLVRSSLLKPGNGNILNLDPQLENVSEKKFNLKANSPAINAGTTLFGITPFDDITGQTRSDGLIDIGAFEYRP